LACLMGSVLDSTLNRTERRSRTFLLHVQHSRLPNDLLDSIFCVPPTTVALDLSGRRKSRTMSFDIWSFHQRMHPTNPTLYQHPLRNNQQKNKIEDYSLASVVGDGLMISSISYKTCLV
jgi:hypothetical protein